MVKNVSGTYTLVPDASWQDLQTDEVRLLCDTSLAPVVINLPAISALSGFYNVKIFIVDASQNAATNNITINAVGGNKIGSDSVELINKNGGAMQLQVLSSTNWLATLSAEMGGGGADTLLGIGTYGEYPLANNPTLDITANGITKAYATLLLVNPNQGGPSSTLKTITFPDLVELNGGLNFQDNGSAVLETVSFPVLSEMVFQSALFTGLTNLTGLNFPKLKKVIAGVDASFGNPATFGAIGDAILTTFSLPALTDIEQEDLLGSPLLVIVAQACPQLTSVDLSALVNMDKCFFAEVYVSNNPLLSTLNLSSLVKGSPTGAGIVYVENCPSMTIISLPAAVSDIAIISQDNAGVISISAPLLTSGYGFGADNNALLNSINLPLYNPKPNAFGIGINATNCPLLPSFSLPAATKSSGLFIENNAIINSVLLPLYDECVGTNNIDFTANPLLPTISFPLLTKIGAALNIVNNAILNVLNLPLLADVANVYINFNPLLPSVNLSALATFNGGTLSVSDNDVLASVTLSPSIDCLNILISGCALTQASVDDILAKLDTAGFSNGSIDLSGGSNSTPSAAGLVSKANLVGKGWTVSTN
jgi:hypothetical protein